MKSKRIKVHRGETLQEAVNNSGFSITRVVKLAKVSRSSYYNHIADPLLSLDILSQYAKALKHDFSEDIPEMASLQLQEEESGYGEPDTIEKWKNKYYMLLEKYNKLLEGKVNK